jgi:genome maintenance exonuclease 1
LASSNFFFEHDPVVIDELDVVEENGRRLYVTPSGQKYPSITTVLSILNQKSIQKWRERVGEEEANRISTRAAGRGTRIHKMCEDYLNNVLQESIDKYSYWDRLMFDSMRIIFDEFIGKVRVQEASLYSDFMRVAGRVDCIAEFDGKLSVIDFKTAAKPKEERYIENYFMQTAGYAVMFEERTGIPISRIVVIIGVDDHGTQLFVKKRDDYIEQFMDVRSDYKKLYGT